MKKRILIALGVLVLAAGIGAGGWYLTVEENHTESCGSSGCDACGSTHRHDECGGLPGTVFSYDKNGAGW